MSSDTCSTEVKRGSENGAKKWNTSGAPSALCTADSSAVAAGCQNIGAAKPTSRATGHQVRRRD